jgi:hypothetical protein
LKLIFLTVSSAMSLLRLSRREDWWKAAEILMLRHQLAIALRERPRAGPRFGACEVKGRTRTCQSQGAGCACE